MPHICMILRWHLERLETTAIACGKGTLFLCKAFDRMWTIFSQYVGWWQKHHLHEATLLTPALSWQCSLLTQISGHVIKHINLSVHWLSLAGSTRFWGALEHAALRGGDIDGNMLILGAPPDPEAWTGITKILSASRFRQSVMPPTTGSFLTYLCTIFSWQNTFSCFLDVLIKCTCIRIFSSGVRHQNGMIKMFVIKYCLNRLIITSYLFLVAVPVIRMLVVHNASNK